jgi:hypothetical protein
MASCRWRIWRSWRRSWCWTFESRRALAGEDAAKWGYVQNCDAIWAKDMFLGGHATRQAKRTPQLLPKAGSEVIRGGHLRNIWLCYDLRLLATYSWISPALSLPLSCCRNDRTGEHSATQSQGIGLCLRCVRGTARKGSVCHGNCGRRASCVSRSGTALWRPLSFGPIESTHRSCWLQHR